MSADDEPPEDFIDEDKTRKALEAARKRAAPGAQKPRRATKTRTSGGYARGALRRAREAVEASPERNNETNRELFNLGQLIAAGELDRDTVEAEIGDAARRAGLGEPEVALLLRDTDSGGINRGIASGPRQRIPAEVSYTPTTSDPPPPPPPVTLDFEDIEDGFWTSRKSLENIYISALSKMCAPWSVLACCAARALYTVRPNIVLPDLIGGSGSLNWFGAITATSGGGKGAASATAKLLVNNQVRQRNTGSGEGIIKAYVRPRNGDEPAGLYESMMFMVDEIDSLTAQTKRSGATTMSVLRSAFSGETLGFSYVNTNTPTIESHTYRMTMIVSVQPTRAADLLADVGGGTPQRFMWFPGTDKRISMELSGGFVEPLTLPRPGEWQYPMTVQIPTPARDLILRERVKSMRGNPNALDGHALFVREKFAFALAILDSRTSVSQEDWELSGVAAKVSDMTRDWVSRATEEAKVEEATEKGVLQGISSLAADEEKEARIGQELSRVRANMIKHLTAAGQNGLSDRELTNKIAFRDRKWIPAVRSKLVNDDLIVHKERESRCYIV